MVMPPINDRIYKLVEEKTSGNVLRFVKMLNENRCGNEISYQRFDGLFRIQKKTGSYPTAHLEIIEAILLRFPEEDAYELVTGHKKSGSREKPDSQLLTQLRKEIDVLKASLLRLSDLVPSVQEETQIQEPTYDHSSSDKTQ